MKKDSFLTKDFIFIFLSNLLLFFGFEMLSTTVPLYMVEVGGTSSEAGIATMIFTATALFTRALGGSLLDRIGRRPVFIGGLIGMTVFTYMYGVVATVVLVILTRFLHGLAWGFTSTSANTVASDVIPKERFGEGMGWFSLSNSLAMALGPAIGLMILNSHSYKDMFTFSAITVVIAAALFLGMKNVKSGEQIRKEREDMRALQAEGTGTEGGKKAGVLEKAAAVPAVTVVFMCMTYGALVTFLALYGKEQGISNPGIFFFVYAAAMLITRPAAGKLTDSKGFTAVVVPGMIIMGAGLLVLGRFTGLVPFLLSAVLYGIGNGAAQAALLTMAVVNAPADRVGAANATFMIGFDAGIGLGAVVMGYVAAALGYGGMYMSAALCVAVALVFYLIFGRKIRR